MTLEIGRFTHWSLETNQLSDGKEPGQKISPPDSSDDPWWNVLPNGVWVFVGSVVLEVIVNMLAYVVLRTFDAIRGPEPTRIEDYEGTYGLVFHEIPTTSDNMHIVQGIFQIESGTASLQYRLDSIVSDAPSTYILCSGLMMFGSGDPYMLAISPNVVGGSSFGPDIPDADRKSIHRMLCGYDRAADKRIPIQIHMEKNSDGHKFLTTYVGDDVGFLVSWTDDQERIREAQPAPLPWLNPTAPTN